MGNQKGGPPLSNIHSPESGDLDQSPASKELRAALGVFNSIEFRTHFSSLLTSEQRRVTLPGLASPAHQAQGYRQASPNFQSHLQRLRSMRLIRLKTTMKNLVFQKVWKTRSLWMTLRTCGCREQTGRQTPWIHLGQRISLQYIRSEAAAKTIDRQDSMAGKALSRILRRVQRHASLSGGLHGPSRLDAGFRTDGNGGDEQASMSVIQRSTRFDAWQSSVSKLRLVVYK